MKTLMRATIVVAVAVAAAILALPMIGHAERSAEQVYKTKCFFCHDNGAGGAPKLGDKAAWETRSKKGLDAITASVKKGMGIMPPMGGCNDCTEAELKGSIKHLMGQGK